MSKLGRWSLAGICAAVLLAGCSGEPSSTGHLELSEPPRAGGPQKIPPGAILAVDLHNRLLVLDAHGRLLRRLGRLRTHGYVIQGVDLAPDRRRAFVAVYRSAPERDGLYELDLGDRSFHEIGVGLSPAVSPDGRRLAYLRTGPPSRGWMADLLGRGADIKYLAGLIVRDLETGDERLLGFPSGVPADTPPGMIVNWAPDGLRVALVEDRAIKIVDVDTAGDVGSVPPLRGATGLLAPVFLDDRTLVALDGCCTGPQRLVAVDLPTQTRSPFIRISSPPEAIRHHSRGTLLLVAAFGNTLELVAKDRIRIAQRDIHVASD